MRLSRLFLFIAGLLLALPAAHAGFLMIFSSQNQAGNPANGATYFVDSVNGNDSNSGLTQALAWQTVTPVNAKVYHAGDSVSFKGGQTFTGPITLSAAVNYAGTPPTLAQPLTIGSYGTGTPTLHITTTSTDALHLTNIGNITVQNLIITGSGASSQKGLRLSNTTTTTQYSNVNFNNIEVSGMSSTGMQVEADGDTSHGFTNLAFNGVNIHSPNAGNASPGLFIAGFFPYQWTSAVYDHQNVTISNSIVTGAGTDGVDFWNVNGGTISNNRFHGNGAVSTGTDANSEIEFQASTNVTFQFNEVDHHAFPTGDSSDGNGINIDRGSSNITAQYNWVHDNAGAGITVFQGSTGIAMSGITVRYNITQNNGTAGSGTNDPSEIILGATGGLAITGLNVYNNTFYSSLGASNVNSIVLFNAANITGNFENNILYGTANPRSINAGTLNPTTMTFLGNDYFGTTKILWNNVSTTTIGAWGRDASALTSDPTLTSPGTGGTTNGYNPGSLGAYKLIAGSPMIGVGQVIASPGSQDYYGLTIPTSTGTGYNVGADGSSPAAAVPSAPTISSPLTGATVTTQVATLSGTGINADTINVTLDGATSNSVATVASGAWSYNTPSLLNGSHTVTATQTNGTGTSVASNSVTFTTSFSSGATPSTSLHYAAGDGQGLLGFNLADVSSVNALNALPAGYKGLVFIGTCAGADSTFQAFVNPFNGNSKLWGFYVVDEPVVANCTTANLKAEVDYIHANITGAKTFVVLENLGTPTSPDFTGYLTPANTDLDYIGMDPYPVRTQFTGGINLGIIGAAVTAAQVPGWTTAQMVPVYQAFGNYQCTGAGPGSDWNLPTASQEQSILVTFGNYMPTPAFDYAYAWGQQCAPPNGPVGDDVISTTGYLQTFYQQRNGVPPPPVILGPTGTVTTTQATITGTGAVVGDTVNVCIDGILVNASCTGGTTSGTSTVNASLAWSFNTAPLANGQHIVTATESNATGSSLLGNQVNFTTNVTVPTTYTLDPAKTTSGITLTNSNLTSAVTTAGGVTVSLGTLGYSTGKFHFELQLTGTGNTAQGTGIATTSYYNGGAAPAAAIGTDLAGNSIALYGNTGNDAVFYKNVKAVTNAGLAVNAGDLIAVEVDIGAGKYWVEDVTTGGGWNGSPTANPATGTGGAAFTPGGQTWYVADEPVNAVVAGRSQTVNFGASQFAAQCSTNFIPWNTSGTACPPLPQPPPAPTVSGPTGTQTVNNVVITGTNNASTDTVTATVKSGSTTIQTGNATVSGLNWSFTTQALANASYTATAVESNSAGTSPASNQISFTVSASVITPNTLDATKTSSTITLSNGNLTSSVATSGGTPQSLSTNGYASGKFHIELQLTGPGNTAQGTGLANASHPLTTVLGSDTSSISWYGNAGNGIFYNNAIILTNAGLTSVAAGDLLAIEVDIGAGKFWAKDVTQNGFWNGSGTADPATGIGGASFTPAGATWFFAEEPSSTATVGRSQTINFGASTFGAQCSTGYVGWNGSASPCPTAPPPPTSGPGTSTPASLLPSDLPTTHWHTTARPWSPLGITAANYLTRLNSMVAWLTPQLNGSGCLNANPFPYYSAGSAGTGGALPLSIGAQLKAGNTTNISAGASSPGVMSMNCDALAYQNAANGQDAGFQMGPLNLAYQLYSANGGASVTAGEKSTWAGNLNHYFGQGTNVNNQTTFGMWGAWLAIQNNLSAFTSTTGSVNGTTGIDCEWTGSSCPFNTNTINQSAAFNDSPFGLYQDSTAVSPNSLQVERQSTTLLLMSTESYSGAQAGAIKTATQKAAQSGMLMQSPDGSNAVGGRVDNHAWVDAGRQLTDDIMAQQVGVSDAFLAGQYQHSAYMAFNEVAKYLNTFCCGSGTFFQVKNHFNPSLSLGSQFAGGADYGYNTQQMYFLAGSYLYRSQSVITEQPAPVEIGGYAFFANGFSQAVLTAGGTSVQLATSGQTVLTPFDQPTLWTALGIERIGRVNWETRIGPSDSGYLSGLGTQTSFAPTWITSGTSWTRLAQNPGNCSGNFTTTFANPAVTFGKVIWTCTTSPAVTFTQNLTVTPDGVMSQTTCSGCPSTWGTTVPILTNDGTSGFGNTVTTTSLNSTNGVLSVTWPPTGDSQNFLTYTPSGTTTAVSEGTQNAVSGILQSERVWTGTGSTSDATQIMFIYPASSGDPSATSVHSTFTPTGTNTYTDTALSSSVVSGTNGTVYVGRTSAGGWASSVTLSSGVISFNVPCNFIAQISAGHVTAIETDRAVTATVQAHTGLNLTAYTPITGL